MCASGGAKKGTMNRAPTGGGVVDGCGHEGLLVGSGSGMTPPGVFLQEWQTKGLGVTKRVRVANAGLKVAEFSAGL